MTDINENRSRSVLHKLGSTIASNKVFLIYTIANFLNQIAYGCNNSIVGSALTDLQYVYHTNLTGISMVASLTALGYMLGSFVGWLYRWVNRQVLILIFIAVHAITIAMVPFCGHLWLLLLNMTFNGMGAGSWDSSNNIWLVEMWPDSSSAVLQGSKFFYGLGTVLGPLLGSPFLYGEVHANDTNSRAFNVTAEQRQHSLALPFAITGLIQITVPIILLVMFFFAPYERKLQTVLPDFIRNKRPSIYNTINSRASFQSIRTNVSLTNQRRARHPSIHISKDDLVVDPEQVQYRAIKLALCAFSIGAYCAVELTYFSFSSVFFQKLEDNPMSATEAARVLSLLATTYSIGRLITAVISIKVIPDIIVVYHFAILIVGQVVVFFFGRHSRTFIYIGTILCGLGFSAIWPGILAFTERHLRLNDKVGMGLSFITGILSLVAPLVISRFIQTFPSILFVLNTFFIPLSLTAFLLANLLIYTTKKEAK